MFIVWGNTAYEQDHGDTVVQGVCPRCNNNVIMRAREYGKKFSLFWIPLFKISSKNFFVCPICGAGSEVSKQVFTQHLASSFSTVPLPPEQPQNQLEE